MTKQKINRHLWLRGEGPIESYLLRRSDQKRCCLGQVLGDNGVPDSILTMSKGPAQIPQDIPTACSYLLHKEAPTLNSELAGRMMGTNDEQAISSEERESRLISMFAEAGVDVEFYNPTVILPRAELQQVVSAVVSSVLKGYSPAGAIVDDIANMLRKHDLNVVIA